jgi:hypothetical protein
MTRRPPRRYPRNVHCPRFGAPRLAVVSALFALFLWSVPAGARAGTTASYTVGDQSIVNVMIRGNADIEVRTWETSVVAAGWGDGDPVVTAKRRLVWRRTGFTIPKQTIRIGRIPDDGFSTVDLPPEEFPIDNVTAGFHDDIAIREPLQMPDFATPERTTHLTIVIPASTRVLIVHEMSGTIAIHDFRGTAIISAVSSRVTLDNLQGDAFAQVLSGSFSAQDSSFGRLRVRSNNASLIFARCNSKQIDASTYAGDVVYDDGTFDPGLAHFASATGNIALGVNGPVQLTGRSQDGHVYTMFSVRGAIDQRSPTNASATLGIGGPLVNAISDHGSIYLYDGSVTSRGALPPEWQPVRSALNGGRRERFVQSRPHM